LLRRYNGDILALLTATFPNVIWDPSRIETKASPTHSPNKPRQNPSKWTDQHCREFMDQLGTTLGYKLPEDWYTITAAQIKAQGGKQRLVSHLFLLISHLFLLVSHLSLLISHLPLLTPPLGESILARYGHSPARVVCSVYSDKALLPWLFSATPVGWWSNSDNQRQYLLWLKSKLNIRRPEDWYLVSNSIVSQHKGTLAFYDTYFVSNVLAIRSFLVNKERFIGCGIDRSVS